MNQKGWECSKSSSNCQSYCHRHEDWRICCILDRVKDIFCDDFLDNIRGTCIVKCNATRNWEVCRIPDIGDYIIRSVNIQGELTSCLTIENWCNQPKHKKEPKSHIHLGPPLETCEQWTRLKKGVGHTGMTSGLTREEIIAQSKVMVLIPIPVFVPNNTLITMFFGAIQQTQLNMLNPVKR